MRFVFISTESLLFTWKIFSSCSFFWGYKCYYTSWSSCIHHMFVFHVSDACFFNASWATVCHTGSLNSESEQRKDITENYATLTHLYHKYRLLWCRSCFAFYFYAYIIYYYIFTYLLYSSLKSIKIQIIKII